MKCETCKFEEGPEYVEVPILVTRGKRKGEVSWVDRRATHAPQWIELAVERGFGFERVIESDGYGVGDYKPPVRLYACPNCKTVRIE